jgi:hypothetical protein
VFYIRTGASGKEGSLPKISLALPVYNGERYLEDCLSSIINQTFEDFELVVSNNASTDKTSEILDHFSSKDPRIRVLHQSQNVGAASNFNLLFHETQADLFKWCACDDKLEPDFLKETYSSLTRSPKAILSHSYTVIHDIDQDTKEIFIPKFSMDSDDPVTRLIEMLHHGRRCYEVFGLIRRSALERTNLIGNYRGGDNVLLFRLALLGRFEIVKKPLFILGRHGEQSTVMVKDTQAYHAWFTGKSGKISFPDWTFLSAAWNTPAGLDLTISEKIHCYKALTAETYRRRAKLRQNLRVVAETLVFGSADVNGRRRLFGSTRHKNNASQFETHR